MPPTKDENSKTERKLVRLSKKELEALEEHMKTLGITEFSTYARRMLLMGCEYAGSEQ